MHLVFLVLQWWTYMIDTILNIVNGFLKEQYPKYELRRSVSDDTTTVQYTFLVDHIAKKELRAKYITVDSYPWVMILDNRTGDCNILKKEIYFECNKIKHSRILTNQLELLGLLEKKTDPNFWENLYNL